VWLRQNRRKPRESQQKYVLLWHYVFANLPHPSQSFQQFAPDTQVATVEDQPGSGSRWNRAISALIFGSDSISFQSVVQDTTDGGRIVQFTISKLCNRTLCPRGSSEGKLTVNFERSEDFKPGDRLMLVTRGPLAGICRSLISSGFGGCLHSRRRQIGDGLHPRLRRGYFGYKAARVGSLRRANDSITGAAWRPGHD